MTGRINKSKRKPKKKKKDEKAREKRIKMEREI